MSDAKEEDDEDDEEEKEEEEEGLAEREVEERIAARKARGDSEVTCRTEKERKREWDRKKK